MDETVVRKDVMVRMRDGVHLRTDVYLPGTPGPYPVLVTRTPYHPDMSAGGAANDPNVGLVQLGYAVVSQHCRGRFGSEGTFTTFPDDLNDGYDTVEWAASQDWSNGRVGMIGASYAGMVQWSAALSQPPHLVAVSPATCSFSYFDGFPYAGRGILMLDVALAWTGFLAKYAGQQLKLNDPVLTRMPEPADVGNALAGGAGDPRIGQIADNFKRDLMPLLQQRPLRDIESFKQAAPWWRDWLSNPNPEDDYWRNVAPGQRPQDVTVPALMTTGWYDTFLPGGINAFLALRNSENLNVANGTRLVIGFWGHGTPSQPVAGHLERVDAAGALGEAEAGAATVDFLNRWVKASPSTAAPAPIRLFVMGDNEWRDEWEWPLARTEFTDYYLHSQGSSNTRQGDGTLSLDAPTSDEPGDSFDYDPDNPVPQIGGRVVTLMSSPGPGPFDQCTVESRSDVLVYTSEALAAELEVTGPVRVELFAKSSAVSTDFTAKLVDVFPDGRAINIAEGIVRTCCAGAKHEVTKPDEVQQLEIDLVATSNVFMPGHCIRLELSSSCFPTWDPNPNTGEHLGTTRSNETMVARNAVFHDMARPSRLVLPVIPRTG